MDVGGPFESALGSNGSKRTGFIGVLGSIVPRSWAKVHEGLECFRRIIQSEILQEVADYEIDHNGRNS